MSDPLSILHQAPEPNNPYAPPNASLLEAQEPPPLPGPAVVLEPFGFWRRAGGRIIDLVVHIVLGLVSGVLVGICAGVLAAVRGVPFQTLQAQMEPAAWVAFVSGILGSTFFQVIMEGWHGSSPGKLLLGMVVLQDDGRPCTMVQAWKRELAYFVDSLFLGAIAASQMSKSPLKKRLGDDWADTVVASRKSAPPGSLRTGAQFVGVGCLAAAADVVTLALPYIVRLSA